MTSAEIFASKRRHVESLIRQHAPAASHAELIALLRPAIALNATPADDAQIPVGASKFGGAPDVAAGFEWPIWKGKSLTFLAQINLAEVAPLDIDKKLPVAGALLFFVMLEEEGLLWEEPEARDGWRVLWMQEPLQRVKPRADADWIVRQSTQTVEFEATWVVSQAEMESLPLDWEQGQWSHFGWDVLEVPPYRMLACPYAPQLSPFVVAANGAQGKNGDGLYDESVATEDWELLLQIDTGAGESFENIHDVGWLYFMIHRDDLRNGDFSRVWMNEQCT